MNQLTLRDMQTHVPIIAWLLIVGHAFVLFVGAFVFTLLTAIGVVSRDSDAMMILGVVGTSVGMFLAALAIPGLVAGYGLLNRKPWARILGIVVGVLGLINFPIGTGIGVYALWVLMQDAANDYFMEPSHV